MAITRYVLLADVTVAAGTASGSMYPGTTTPGGGWSGQAPSVFRKGQVVQADPVAGNGAASALYTAIGAGNLRAVTARDQAGESAAASNSN